MWDENHASTQFLSRWLAPERRLQVSLVILSKKFLRLTNFLRQCGIQQFSSSSQWERPTSGSWSTGCPGCFNFFNPNHAKIPQQASGENIPLQHFPNQGSAWKVYFQSSFFWTGKSMQLKAALLIIFRGDHVVKRWPPKCNSSIPQYELQKLLVTLLGCLESRWNIFNNPVNCLFRPQRRRRWGRTGTMG